MQSDENVTRNLPCKAVWNMKICKSISSTLNPNIYFCQYSQYVMLQSGSTKHITIYQLLFTFIIVTTGEGRTWVNKSSHKINLVSQPMFFVIIPYINIRAQCVGLCFYVSLKKKKLTKTVWSGQYVQIITIQPQFHPSLSITLFPTALKKCSFPNTLLSEFGISYSNILPRYNQNQYKEIS